MSFSIGRTLGRTFSPISGNAATVLGVGALFSGVPAAVVAALEFQAAGGAIPGLNEAVPLTPAYGAAVLVQLLLAFLAQAALIHTAVGFYRGRRVGFGEALGAGVRHLVPLIVISILFFFGLALGFTLLVLPGVFLLVKWSVTFPSRVVENAGIIGSFKRSWALTRDHWLPVFGFMLALIFVLLGAGVVIGIVLALAFAGLGFLGGPIALGVLVLVQIVFGTAQVAIGSGAAAALYDGLLTEHEGGDTEALRQTFA